MMNLQQIYAHPVTKAFEAIGINTASGTLAAVVLTHPVGAAGGAIYGVLTEVIAQLTKKIADKALPKEISDNLMFKLAIMTMSYFSAWKLAALVGVNMGLKSVVILTAASAVAHFGISFLIVTVLMVIGIIPMPDEAKPATS